MDEVRASSLNGGDRPASPEEPVLMSRPPLSTLLALCLPAALLLTADARATVLTYSVNSATGNSWGGTIDVPSMTAAVDLNVSSVSTITAASGTTSYSWAPNYCGTNNVTPYIEWDSFSGGFSSLHIESTAFQTLYNSANDTWNDAVSTGTFAISGNTSVSYQGASNVLQGAGGTITFAVAVPEPMISGVAASAALAGFVLARRRPSSP
jgi:hypothetical protein